MPIVSHKQYPDESGELYSAENATKSITCASHKQYPDRPCGSGEPCTAENQAVPTATRPDPEEA